MGIKTIIRADGSYQIGLGHVIRCLEIGRCLRERGCDVIFVTRDHPEAIAKFSEFELHTIPRQADMADEFKLLGGYVNKIRPDALILDIRDTDSERLSPFYSQVPLTVHFDDLGSGSRLARIIIDSNRQSSGNGNNGQRHLFGPGYLILRRDFKEFHRLTKKVPERVKTILVAMGGSDPAGLTEKVLSVLHGMDLPGVDIETVIGSANGRKSQIESMIDNLGVRTRLHTDIEDIAELMYRADLGVISGGITMGEMACIGTPAMVLGQVPHEVDNARRFAGEGAVVNLGLGEELADNRLRKAVFDLIASPEKRLRLSCRGKELIDGYGLDRFVDTVEDHISAKNEP
jgi:spore coat polysaccharide biosynthesis predicted glycosyltransferase SpsG